ncbi:MAG: ABC transporter ATP-binding protein [Acidimicrobiales bacterium]
MAVPTHPISVWQVSKYFNLKVKGTSLAENSRFDERLGFAALRDISFSAESGESIGLVGRNGAGKTTLLRLLAGVSRPTSGAISVESPIASVLTLRAGLDPRISGRDTIFTLGALMGVPASEIAERLDEIVEFSEIGTFLDQPLNTYSPGMAARLAFSAATHVDAKVLLVDEVIGVGDSSFQAKAAARVAAQFDRGMTTIVSSHNLAALERLCERILWIHDGEVVDDGPLDSILPQYRAHLLGESPAIVDMATSQPNTVASTLGSVGTENGSRRLDRLIRKHTSLQLRVAQLKQTVFALQVFMAEPRAAGDTGQIQAPDTTAEIIELLETAEELLQFTIAALTISDDATIGPPTPD